MKRGPSIRQAVVYWLLLPLAIFVTALLSGCASKAPSGPAGFADYNIHAPEEHLILCVLTGPCTLWTDAELKRLAQDMARKGYEIRRAEEAAERKGKSL